jgi:phytoene dehydrogenase-like protein
MFLDLVPSRHLTHKFEQRIRSYRGYGLTAVMRLALNGPLEFRGREKDPIVRARIGADLDGLELAFDPAKYDALPETPSLDVYVPSLEDPSLAPTGHHVVTIHARCVPYRLAEGWQPDGRIDAERRILGALFRHAPGAEARIVGAEFLSPVDLEAKYGLVQGHLHHGDHALDQLLVRPSPECMHSRTPVGGLALWGGGVHPGTALVEALSDRAGSRSQ